MLRLIDRLFEAVDKKGHVCLGLDTAPDYLPESFFKGHSSAGEAIFCFNRRIIEATLDAVAVYKVQIAYYEALGLDGLAAYAKTLAFLRKNGAIVIADVKRGDIAKTAEMYAKAHFSGEFEADFITVNPFMGMDTLSPFYPWLKTGDKGIFSLVATSNPGASDIEGLICKDGASVSEKLGAMIKSEGEAFMGACGYGAVGAVVGCTNKEQTVSIRERMPGVFFLIPGYGAQGGKAEDMKNYFVNGNGGVVNSSRGILLAYKKDERPIPFDEAARGEVLRMRDDIRNAI
ncbi:MAG: orotidine-5'-phosphate decarboxylase [Oscillospiraceae bacterium]|jgi:orotidine-5'-phosphate decarboxylase|nr:orotidine-5'-phosphate decarboxylase [Oscillospiraceae bacterium]